MTDRHDHHDHHDRRFHRAAIIALEGAALLLVCAVAFTWAWGAIAVDLFHLPKADFKHALALEAAVAGLIALTAWAGRLGRGRDAAADGSTS